MAFNLPGQAFDSFSIVFVDSRHNTNDLKSFDEEEKICCSFLGMDPKIITNIVQKIERNITIGSLSILCSVAHTLNMLSTMYATDSNFNLEGLEKDPQKSKLMAYLVHVEWCYDIICMGPKTFI